MALLLTSFYSVLVSSVISTILTFLLCLSFTLLLLYCCICRQWKYVRDDTNNETINDQVPEPAVTISSIAASAEYFPEVYTNPHSITSSSSEFSMSKDESMSMTLNPAYYKFRYFGERSVVPGHLPTPLPPPPIVSVMPPTPPITGQVTDNGVLYEELTETISERIENNNNIEDQEEVTYLTILA